MNRRAGAAGDAVTAEAWYGLDPAGLRERIGVPEAHLFRSIGSTNDLARELAEAGAPAGTLVVAEEQTRGRGRRGGGWHAPPGTGLLFSLVLRPAVPTGPAAAPGTLPVRVGIAVADAALAVAGVRLLIKWPNDLLADGRKVAGILCEGAFAPGRAGYIVAGVGINVAQRAEHWPADLRGAAASLEELAGRAIDAVELLRTAVAGMLELGADAGPLPAGLQARLARLDALRGRPISVDGRPAGTADGLGADGALLARSKHGVRRIHHGTVRITEAEP